ncbi:MAG: hypothetical protein ACYDH6_24640 [Acidimicrobiales bacterium]
MDRDEAQRDVLRLVNNPERITFGPETRRARLFTEIIVDGETFNIEAVGKRGCSTNTVAFDEARTTVTYGLECSATYFGAENSPLGPIHIVQDPRIVNRGWILLKRNAEGEFDLPALSFFNQHLIFHVGDRWYFYPAAWQVVSAITQWPPEGHQYHHLEPDTPIFDFVTREPNVARKGISTIWIEGPLEEDENRRYDELIARELKLIDELPASKMSPEDLTPSQLVRG